MRIADRGDSGAAAVVPNLHDGWASADILVSAASTDDNQKMLIFVGQDLEILFKQMKEVADVEWGLYDEEGDEEDK